MFRICLSLFIVASCLLAGGCGPGVSREELGEVQFSIPRVPGSESPPPMPQIDDLPTPPREPQTDEP